MGLTRAARRKVATAQERAQLPPDAQRALLRLELLAADIEKVKQRN